MSIQAMNNRVVEMCSAHNLLMTPSEFISLLAERRVHLFSEGENLKFRAPEGAVDEKIRQMLRIHKVDLLRILARRTAPLLISPLSYNQQSLFFLHLLEPASSAYNLALAIRLYAAVSPETLHRAIERLVRKHEQLRTTYEHGEFGRSLIPVQLVHDMLSPSFETFDARDWREEDLSVRIQAFYDTPFDLQQGPVVRAGLFIRGAAESILTLVVHHIAADAWSMRLILQDLANACIKELGNAGNASAGEEYIDFTVAQGRELADKAGQDCLKYWVEQHRPPSPALALGEGRRPPVRRSVGATHYFRIEPSVRREVENAAREQGVTTFALLLSVFQWLLFEQTGQDDVVVGIPTLGRNDPRFEKTVGYFVNPVALRSRRKGRQNFLDHALATARELRSALDHRDAPFAAVVEQLGCDRDTSRTPVFQVMFNLLSRRLMGDAIDFLYPFEEAREVDFGGITATAYCLNQQEGQFDLTLEFIDNGDHLLGFLKYCTDLFSPEKAALLAARFLELLDRALAAPASVHFPSADPDAADPVPDEQTSVVAISATFTAEVLEDFCAFWFQRLDWKASVRFAPFNQVFQELLNPSSLLRRNRDGHNIVMVRCEDLLEGAGKRPVTGVNGTDGRIPMILDELRLAVVTAAQNMAVPLCFVLCPPSEAGAALQDRYGRAIEAFLESLRSIPGVTVLTHRDIIRHYPVIEYQESLGETIGRIPYARPYLAALATTVVRSLHASSRGPIKAIVLDCDGTLWDGVAAEDGPEGVLIGPWQRKFQEYILEQHRAGTILCICSKNRESDVWAVFDQNPLMLLRREHIAFQRINWERKSANIQALRTAMNIGLDAIAFLDDNPVERAEIRTLCPSVLCPELPEAWEERTAWLEHLWVLDQPGVTAEDLKRQQHYRSEKLRDDFRQHTGSFIEFLEKLDLNVEFRPAETSDFDRLAQLSMRTNQFNTTMLRLSAKDVAEYAAAFGCSAHVARVSDRFGDYGMVGGMLACAVDSVLRVEGMFLSCRALGRGVEHRMASYMGLVARQAGCSTVAFALNTTDRNEPAGKFLAQLGRFANGSQDDRGFLRTAAEHLADLRYQEMLHPSETAGPDRDSDAFPLFENTSFDDLEKFSSIAGELRTTAEILNAVDRLCSERQGTNRVKTEGARVTPATETEMVIAGVWKRTLGIADICVETNFFDAGGSSLMLAQIAIELGRDHGLNVSLVDMFQYPTILELARHLQGTAQSGNKSDKTTANAMRRREVLQTQHLPEAFKRLKQVRG